ncbi:hypothetical protein V3H18_09800 [Methylocystis sp. 9N]|uniref:EF-hand domain-containing protein n=1 Tax=Methylocystis borbori TaxID=3118750 RepID=A0ABU7XHG6_9HYPH
MKSKLASLFAVGPFALFPADKALALTSMLPVSQLLTATAITGTEYVPIVQDGATRKTTMQRLFQAVTPSNIPNLDASKVLSGIFDGPRIPLLEINYKTSGVLGSTRGRAGSMLDLLKADGKGVVSKADLLDFSGYALAYQYPGIDPTGATNSQPGIQAMINATNTRSAVQLRGQKLYFGPGRFRVDDKILLGSAQALICAGRNKTTFVVNSSTFNMNAYAVFEVPPYSNAGAAKDCEVEFVQPNFPGMTRNHLIKYPPAFFLNTAPGFIFDGIRCRHAYRCIIALGNNGASDFGTIESGAAAPYQFAAFTADASGTTLHVTAVGSGQIAVPGFGYKVERTGVYTVYRIVNQSGGPTGGVGDYQLAWATSFSSGPNYQTDGGNVIDGALDFIRNQAFRCYPYGYLGSHSYAAYTDGGTSCLALGRADGFDFDNLSSSNAEVVLTPRANGHAHFASLELDSDMSRLRTFAGEPSIGFLALSSAGAMAREQVHAENSTITIDHLKNINNSSNCIVNVGTNGRIYILGGVLQNSQPDGKFLCFDAGAAGGFARVANSMINNSGGTRTQPFFVQTGATNSMQLIGNARHANLSNGGPIYSYAADNFGNLVAGNHFYPQTHVLPLSSVGAYETDTPDALATPTIAFATPGSPITVNSSSGKYWRKGDRVELELSVDFKTPVATSEAGDLRIFGTGMPWPRFKSETSCQLDDAAKVAFSGFFSPIITHAVLGTPLIQFRQFVSGGASTLLGTAGFPQNTDHFIVKFHCSYPV